VSKTPSSAAKALQLNYPWLALGAGRAYDKYLLIRGAFQSSFDEVMMAARKCG
jgi:hypothetical protein